jgi:hypothetical protein
MVFVYGMDVPLIELIFVLTIVLIVLLILIVYLIVNQVKLMRRLKFVFVNGRGKSPAKQQSKKVVRQPVKKEVRQPVKKVPVRTRTVVKTVVKRPKKVYIASINGKIVHEKNCPFARNIKKDSRIVFRSKTKAFNEGYNPCSCIMEAKVKKKRRRSKKVVTQPVQKVPVRTRTVTKRSEKVYVASTYGNALHEQNCPFAKRIDERNKVYFKSKIKAFDQGYKACNCI